MGGRTVGRGGIAMPFTHIWRSFKRTLHLAFVDNWVGTIWGLAIKMATYIFAAAAIWGIEWDLPDLKRAIPIGTTGYYFPISAIVIGILIVLAVCFAISWNKVPRVEIYFTRSIMAHFQTSGTSESARSLARVC